jgi:serine/threonine protein kinase/tetratricopeptide (TPR) repeat protein
MRDLIGHRLGHYLITAKLGEGGMGVVYRAHDERLDRDVAIKVLPEEVAQDQARLERFEREAKAVAKLDHPNILAIHELGTHEGAPFIVTELLEGENLRERVPSGGMGWQKATEIGAAVAEGLAAAHGKGVIHRDLKPENIFITSDGRVKILDFGLAQVKAPLETETDTATLTPAGTVPGTVMGTVGYMSPEQVRGKPADERSDIFALGCVLYEMLTGNVAFARESTADTQAAILKEELPALSTTGVPLPAELERSIHRCLEKSPEARFQSASDLAYNLRSITTDRAVPMATPTAVTPRRRKATLWAVAAVAAALVAAAVVLGPRLLDRTSSAVSDKPIRSLAVLPLQNISGDPDQEYFADGMTDALITELGKISSISVIGRHSAMRYKGSDTPLQEIAEALSVDAFVVGSTVASGDRVRVAIQLTSPDSDRVLWSENYERDLADIVGLQGDVARAIAEEIQAEVTPDEKRRVTSGHRVAPEAMRAHLMGLSVRGKMQYAESVEHFERAISIDPSFAEAYASLAGGVLTLAAIGSARDPVEAVRRAGRLLDRALELEPDLSEAHGALGRLRGFEWDWAGSMEALQHAVDLNPSNADARTTLGLHLILDGQFDPGIQQCQTAQSLDPLTPETNMWLGAAYGWAGRWDEAIRQLEFLRDLDPSWDHVHHCLGFGYASAGRWDDAVASCDQWMGHFRGSLDYCGPIYALTGYREKALDRLALCTRGDEIDPMCAAGIHAGLGDVDEALAWVETAYQQRTPMLVYWMRMPLLIDNLRDDPRFKDIERGMGLSEYRR